MPLHDGRVAGATATLSSAAIGPRTLTLFGELRRGVKTLSGVFEGKPHAGTIRHAIRPASSLGT
jgi:hypothetical protein